MEENQTACNINHQASQERRPISLHTHLMEDEGLIYVMCTVVLLFIINYYKQIITSK